jgi:hypothetical protein
VIWGCNFSVKCDVGNEKVATRKNVYLQKDMRVLKQKKRSN